MIKQEWIAKGYADEPVSESLNLKEEIRRLCKEKDAVVLAHYYTTGDVQDVATLLATRWRWPAKQHKPTHALY